MRILKLTDRVAGQFLARRSSHDAAAERVAARILADVRKNGDAALFRWAARLDGIRLRRKSLWISRAKIRAAHRGVSRELLRSIEHAARNIRRVANMQLPRAWTTAQYWVTTSRMASFTWASKLARDCCSARLAMTSGAVLAKRQALRSRGCVNCNVTIELT